MEKEHLLEQEFQLLKNIIQPSKRYDISIDISNLENIIFKELPDALEKNAPPNFPELYFDFKYEYERFKQFILYEKLIGKNVVALGGGFSTGKSRFLNTLLGEKILPCNINPSTSVPAYLVNGTDISVHGINVFQSNIQMNIEDVKTISHGFGKKVSNGEEITLGHLLSSIFINTPNQPYKNIALLDTPGYSKADTADYSAKTDEKIAKAQLDSSNYILWFVQADGGTITDADIEFIKKLKADIPKLIIVNKADKVMESELAMIVSKIKDVLDMKGIFYLDVLTYSSVDANKYDGNKIKEYLQKWDEEKYNSKFAYNFKVLFVKCKEYYDNLLDEEKKTHSRLEHILADVSLENADARDYLDYLNKNSTKSITLYKELQENLKKLKDEFFLELKRIADKANIEMPEPSELEIQKDKITNPKDVLDEYCKKKGFNTQKHTNYKNDIEIILSEAFSDFKPVFNDICGSKNYQNELINLMTDILNIKKEDIHINDCMKYNYSIM